MQNDVHLVGEKGYEILFRNPRGGLTVIPHEQSKTILEGGITGRQDGGNTSSLITHRRGGEIPAVKEKTKIKRHQAGGEIEALPGGENGVRGRIGEFKDRIITHQDGDPPIPAAQEVKRPLPKPPVVNRGPTYTKAMTGPFGTEPVPPANPYDNKTYYGSRFAPTNQPVRESSLTSVPGGKPAVAPAPTINQLQPAEDASPEHAAVLARAEQERIGSIRTKGGVVAPMSSFMGQPVQNGSYLVPYPAGDASKTDPAGDAAYAEYLKAHPAKTTESVITGRGGPTTQPGKKYGAFVINGSTVRREVYTPGEGWSSKITDLGAGHESEMYKEQQEMEREKLKEAGATERTKLSAEDKLAATEARAQAQIEAAKISGYQLTEDGKSAFNPRTGKKISVGTQSQADWPVIERAARQISTMSDNDLTEFAAKKPDLLSDAVDKIIATNPDFIPSLLERLRKLKISIQ